MKKLVFAAITRFLLGVFLTGLLIFLPAGTFSYFQGWLFVGVLFVPMFFAGIVMAFKCPELLQKRLNIEEKQKEQGTVVKLSALIFAVSFVLSGLGVRLDWYVLSKNVCFAACAFFLISYVLYAEVLRENKYLSRTVEVQENQTVVSTGLYGVVRHPMYAVTVIMFLTMPLILGSVYGFLALLPYPFIIAVRIKHEEKLLENELAGYTQYKQKVKYRLLPFVW